MKRITMREGWFATMGEETMKKEEFYTFRLNIGRHRVERQISMEVLNAYEAGPDALMDKVEEMALEDMARIKKALREKGELLVPK